MTALQMAIGIKKANKARLDNRWGCSVGQAFHNFNPSSRFDAHLRPSGASALTFCKNETSRNSFSRRVRAR